MMNPLSLCSRVSPRDFELPQTVQFCGLSARGGRGTDEHVSLFKLVLSHTGNNLLCRFTELNSKIITKYICILLMNPGSN